MAGDHLNPTDFVLVQNNQDQALSLSDVSGYTVVTKDHGYGPDGGRIAIDIAIPKEIMDAAGGTFDSETGNPTPEVLAFHEAIKCALAEKGINAAGSDLFGAQGTLMTVNGQTPEEASYQDYTGGDGSFHAVGNVMGRVDAQDFARDGEEWSPVDVTRIYIADNEATAGLSEEELAEIVRQAYYEAFHGVDDADVPKVDYRGDGANADIDNLPDDPSLKQCQPATPVA